jgi:hypothetical protein
MEPQALHAALTATLSQNQSERQAAETVLRGLDATPGYLPCLFQIINSSEVVPQVKQAGIIYFKNLVAKNWQHEHSNPRGGVVFSEVDKNAVRAGILDALLVASHLTRPQIVQSLRAIVQHDFPHKMPVRAYCTHAAEIGQWHAVAVSALPVCGGLAQLIHPRECAQSLTPHDA